MRTNIRTDEEQRIQRFIKSAFPLIDQELKNAQDAFEMAGFDTKQTARKLYPEEPWRHFAPPELEAAVDARRTLENGAKK